MKDTFLILQIIISALVVVAISIQVKGGGFSRNFTAGSFTRRGLERIVFRSTFVLVFLFVLVSVLQFAV